MIKSMPRYKASFVVLTWNSEKYIEDCVSSILRLEFRALQLIIVDNGSTDRTKEYVNSIAQLDTRVHLIELSKNYGTTKSRNIALKKISADTDFVCILDSDTVVTNDAFEELTNQLLKHADVGVIGPSMHNSHGQLQVSGRSLPNIKIKFLKASPIKKWQQRGAELELPGGEFKYHVRDVGYLISACWYMPYRTLETVGYLDEKIFYAPEDVDYCARVHLAGLRVVSCNSAEIMHDYQRLSHQKLLSMLNVEHIKGLVYYFFKYRYLFSSSKIFRDR